MKTAAPPGHAALKRMSFRCTSKREKSATIEANNAHTLKAAKTRQRLFVAMALCLAVHLGAEQPAQNFQSQEFRSALGQVLHARFDNFAELKTSGAVFQLPKMSCSFEPQGKVASYLCSASAASRPEAESLYNNLAATLKASLPGYPLCRKPANTDGIEVTSFCHYPTIVITDASVQIEKSLVSLRVFGREAGDGGEPVQFLHAYSLAELGRHAEALDAWKPILGPEIDRRIYDHERFAYDAAVKETQDCAAQQLCMASDFLAIGNTKEASRWQSKTFKSVDTEAEANRQRGYKLDPAGAKSVALADDYDLNARILAAKGKLDSALSSLDTASDALPSNAKAMTRKAMYAYHRALILAENKKYAKAAKACQESLSVDGATFQDELDRPQCVEIEVLASGDLAAGVSH
jgi:tetratricopeptide (TPR) repeat protein